MRTLSPQQAHAPMGPADVACDPGRMPARRKSRYPGIVVASPRALSCVLAIALAVPCGVIPQHAFAGPSRKEAKEAKDAAKLSAEEEAQLAEARDLFEQGKAKYDTFDYKGAIDLWQIAYSKVPTREAGVRHAMVYNIALAQEKSYDLDKDAAHLRQAVMLLEQWVRDFKTMYKKTPETEAEVNKANARIAELKKKIAIAEGGEPPPDPPTEEQPKEADPPPPSTEIEFDSGYSPPPEVLQERRKQAAENESEGLIAAGWAVGGIGLLFAAAGAGTLAGVRNPAGRGGGGGGLGLGISMMVAGSVLLGVGYKKKKAVARGDYSIVPAPILTPRMAGAGMTVRF